jgi:hypothetical protein
VRDKLYKHKHRPILVKVLNDSVDLRVGATIKRRGVYYVRADKLDDAACRAYHEFLGLFEPYEQSS